MREQEAREQDRRDAARSGSRDSTLNRWKHEAEANMRQAQRNLTHAIGDLMRADGQAAGLEFRDEVNGLADINSDIEGKIKRMWEQP